MIRYTENPRVFQIDEKDLSLMSLPLFESELDSVLESLDASVYLDCSCVEEVSSAILGVLMAKKKKLQKSGRDIYLMNLSDSLEKVLIILKLREFLTLSVQSFQLG